MEPEYILKLLLIGDRGVGRSTFLRTLRDVDVYEEDYIETLGVTPYRKEIHLEVGLVTLFIWEISHKKSFEKVLNTYINGSNGVLLMFDVFNSKSLDFLSEYPQKIREQAGDIPILLVGNKGDLGVKRVVSKEEGKAFVRTNELLGYIDISAKNGRECEGALELLVKTMVKQTILN
ncbi:MAG: GTP-binding protein [Candidatus Odinarchaeota archaeon]